MWQLARSPEKRGCQAFFQRTPPARQPNRIGKEWQNSREIVGTLAFWHSEWRAGYPEGCPSQLAELGWQVWLRGAIGALLRSYRSSAIAEENAMYISALTTSIKADFPSAIRQMAELGFTHADVVAQTERPMMDPEALADSGLLVSCAAVGRGLAGGRTLNALHAHSRRAVLEEMQQHVADAARLCSFCCSEPAHRTRTGQ